MKRDQTRQHVTIGGHLMIARSLVRVQQGPPQHSRQGRKYQMLSMFGLPYENAEVEPDVLQDLKSRVLPHMDSAPNLGTWAAIREYAPQSDLFRELSTWATRWNLESEDDWVLSQAAEAAISIKVSFDQVIWYWVSLTFSIQVTALLSSCSCIAMCVIAVVGVAPCQCFSPGANQTTSPGWISSIGAPSR